MFQERVNWEKLADDVSIFRQIEFFMYFKWSVKTLVIINELP